MRPYFDFSTRVDSDGLSGGLWLGWLKYVPLTSHPCKRQQQQKQILWSFPDPGTSALNTDGCPKGNPGPASIIGIIRDDRGVWICGYDGKIPDTTSLEAELWSIFKRLSLVRDRRIPRLMVETYSQAAIELIQDKEKGQGYSYNVPPTNRKKVSPRKHLGLGSFSLACDRARRSTAESQKGKTYMAPIQSQELLFNHFCVADLFLSGTLKSEVS